MGLAAPELHEFSARARFPWYAGIGALRSGSLRGGAVLVDGWSRPVKSCWQSIAAWWAWPLLWDMGWPIARASYNWRNYQRRLDGWVQRSATNPKF